jgi:transcriptional regulator with XRE-family HTH domain
MATARPPRRCTECGEPQRLTCTTTDYPESGLDNVRLVDVPVWECGNGHQEVEIPKAEQLHGLLVNALISKSAALAGPEIRFLRKELGMSGRAFARQLGMTAEHLSRLETGRRTVSPTTSLLVRLAVAWELTRRRRIEFPSELRPFVSDLEVVSDAGAHRVQYRGDAPRERPWTSLSA